MIPWTRLIIPANGTQDKRNKPKFAKESIWKNRLLLEKFEQDKIHTEESEFNAPKVKEKQSVFDNFADAL